MQDEAVGGWRGWFTRRPEWLLLVVPLLAIVVGTALIAIAGVTHSRVEVRLALVECAGDDASGGEHAESRVPVVAITDTTRCSVEVTVLNPGPLEVNVNTIGFPTLGPDGGGVAQMTGPRRVEADPHGDQIDAEFRLDRSLRRGDSVRFQAVLSARHAARCEWAGTIDNHMGAIAEISTAGYTTSRGGPAGLVVRIPQCP